MLDCFKDTVFIITTVAKKKKKLNETKQSATELTTNVKKFVNSEKIQHVHCLKRSVTLIQVKNI